MANKITYADKVAVEPKGIHINQVWDDDINEIKEKHNLNDDRITQNEGDIYTLQSDLSSNTDSIIEDKQSKYVLVLNPITQMGATVTRKQGFDFFVDLFLNGFDTSGKYYGATTIRKDLKTIYIYEVDANGSKIGTSSEITLTTQYSKDNFSYLEGTSGDLSAKAVVDWNKMNDGSNSISSIRFSDNVYKAHYGALTQFEETKEFSDFKTGIETTIDNNVNPKIAEVKYEAESDIIESDNIHDLTQNIYNKTIVSTSGLPTDDTSRYITPFYSVEPSTAYYSSGFVALYFYTKEEVYISRITSGLSSFTTPANTHLIIGVAFKSSSQFNAYISKNAEYGVYSKKTQLSRSLAYDVSANLSTDETKFNQLGGIMHEGSYGGLGSIYRLPLKFDGKFTLDFDFVAGVDVHKAVSTWPVLVEINALDADDVNLAYESLYTQIRWAQSVQSTTMYYAAPIYNTNLSGKFGTSTMDTPVNIARYMKHHLNGDIAFSFRKLNPVAADIDMTVEVTDSALIVAQSDGTVLHTFDFATYSTIEALGAAVNAVTDYQFKYYGYQGKDSDQLAITKFIVVSEINEIYADGDNYGDPTGETIIDNYECFFYLTGANIEHKCRLTLEEVNNTVELIFYFDGNPIFKGVITGKYTAPPYIYLGGDLEKTKVIDGLIKNVRMRNDIIEPPHGIAMIGHAIEDSTIGISGNDSVHNYEKMLIEIKERGYSFVSSDMFVDIMSGALKEGDFPNKFATIFQDDWHPEMYLTPAFRSMYERQGVKPILPLILKYIDTAPADEIEAIQMAYKAGWGIWSHTINHVHINAMSYDQLSDMLDGVAAYANTLGVPINTLIYPGGYSDDKSCALLEAKGVTVGGSNSKHGRTYQGRGNYQWFRMKSEDWYAATDLDDIDRIDDAIRHW